MRRLLLTLTLTACGTDSTAPIDGGETTCETFINDPTYVYAGGRVTIDTTDVDELAVLGVPFFIAPGGQPSSDDNATMPEPDRWSVLAVRWNGQIGRAIQLWNRNGEQACRAVWLDRL